MDNFSTNPVNQELLEEIKQAISGKEYGSVEIYIESGRVVQITERVIKKTNHRGELKPENRRPNYLYGRSGSRPAR